MANRRGTEGAADGRPLWEIDGVVDRARRLWLEDGRSASEIARDLCEFTGQRVTRNTVIGKLHRLGLSASDKGFVPPVPAPTGQPVIDARVDDLAPAGSEPEAAAHQEPVERLPFRPPIRTDPPAEGRLLVDLRMSECRYPISPDTAAVHRFCGARVEDPGSSWCAAHAEVVFDRTPAAVRKAKRDEAFARRKAA